MQRCLRQLETESDARPYLSVWAHMGVARRLAGRLQRPYGQVMTPKTCHQSKGVTVHHMPSHDSPTPAWPQAQLERAGRGSARPWQVPRCTHCHVAARPCPLTAYTVVGADPRGPCLEARVCIEANGVMRLLKHLRRQRLGWRLSHGTYLLHAHTNSTNSTCLDPLRQANGLQSCTIHTLHTSTTALTSSRPYRQLCHESAPLLQRRGE